VAVLQLFDYVTPSRPWGLRLAL